MEFPGGKRKRGESGKRISKEKAKASINRAALADRPHGKPPSGLMLIDPLVPEWKRCRDVYRSSSF